MASLLLKYQHAVCRKNVLTVTIILQVTQWTVSVFPLFKSNRRVFLLFWSFSLKIIDFAALFTFKECYKCMFESYYISFTIICYSISCSMRYMMDNYIQIYRESVHFLPTNSHFLLFSFFYSKFIKIFPFYFVLNLTPINMLFSLIYRQSLFPGDCLF